MACLNYVVCYANQLFSNICFNNSYFNWLNFSLFDVRQPHCFMCKTDSCAGRSVVDGSLQCLVFYIPTSAMCFFCLLDKKKKRKKIVVCAVLLLIWFYLLCYLFVDVDIIIFLFLLLFFTYVFFFFCV